MWSTAKLIIDIVNATQHQDALLKSLHVVSTMGMINVTIAKLPKVHLI